MNVLGRLLLLVASAQAAPLFPSNAGHTATTVANQVARATEQLRGDASITAALQTVQVGTHHADAEQALAALGFETALDLQLLAGGPEAAELMATLRTGGELSIADRAKIRLLVGDREHLARVAMVSSSPFSGSEEEEQAAPRHRQLQDEGDSDHGTLSADSIAIVFSVCVGVCGYLLQAWTAEKASRHAGELQREHDQQARDRQVQQDRTQAQIRRTERWVDDCCFPASRALSQYMWSRQRFGKFTAYLALAWNCRCCKLHTVLV